MYFRDSEIEAEGPHRREGTEEKRESQSKTKTQRDRIEWRGERGPGGDRNSK